MHTPTRHREPDPTPEEAAARRKAYIAAFNARSPAEIELDLIDHKDSPWTYKDRRRRAELLRIIESGG